MNVPVLFIGADRADRHRLIAMDCVMITVASGCAALGTAGMLGCCFGRL